MYTIKPTINHDTHILLPKCMYKMKNINGTSTTTESTSSGATESLDISEQRPMERLKNIAVHQQEVLQELQHLRLQIESIRDNLKSADFIVPNTPTMGKKSIESQSNLKSIKAEDLTDIVINVSPAYIPYSLLAVKKLWGDVVHLVIESYIHSTVTALSGPVQEFTKQLTEKLSSKPQYSLRVALIWKDVGPRMEMITLSAYAPIRGEVNILRYLNRVVPSLIEYENNQKVNEIDSILDICYRLTHHRTVKERQSIIRLLNSKLGKSEWLCKTDGITLADVGVSSALKQINTGNDVTANMNKWLQRCTTVLGY